MFVGKQLSFVSYSICYRLRVRAALKALHSFVMLLLRCQVPFLTLKELALHPFELLYFPYVVGAKQIPLIDSKEWAIWKLVSLD